jgi:IMP dehydrogenase/GMP reductase
MFWSRCSKAVVTQEQLSTGAVSHDALRIDNSRVQTRHSQNRFFARKKKDSRKKVVATEAAEVIVKMRGITAHHISVLTEKQNHFFDIVFTHKK